MQTIRLIPRCRVNPVAMFALATIALTCVTARAATVKAPYANDFTDETSDFTFASASKWVHLPALGVYSNEFETSTGIAGQTAGNLGSAAANAKPFTVTSDFTLLSGNGTGSYVGLCFLSGSESLPDANGYKFYHVIATSSGTGIPLFLRRNNVEVANSTSFMQLRHTTGTKYRFIVKGVYVDTDADGVNDALDITASIENPATEARATITYRDPAPLTGNAFGVKHYNANNNTRSAVYWDAFTITDDTPKATLVVIR